MSKIADDSEAIAKRLAEIQAEKRAKISGMPIETPADLKPFKGYEDLYGSHIDYLG